MPNSRRGFLGRISMALLTALSACRRSTETTSASSSSEPPPPGAPSAFGTSPDAGPPVSTATFVEAEKIVQFTLTPADRATAAGNWRKSMAPLYERRVGPRKFSPASSVAPATKWDPLLPGIATGPNKDRFVRPKSQPVPLPANDADIAYATVAQLSRWIESRKLTSERLTNIYLDRLQRFDPKLHCVITLTRDLAMTQAQKADAEIAAGKYRGPLHGIPWGAKDLLAVKGYPTTWGAAGFEHQQIDEDAEVVKRLDAAGAVLIAKMTLGALAQGDLWFGGRTRNPWNPQQGSSGSSAGSASATAAGCVGFAIGTETLGSISSPSTRCGATGLRPSFGRVPRTGAMALSWSMDKIGPIARSVEDCALVLHAIAGPDGQDLSVHSGAFNADLTIDIRRLRVGYVKSAFDAPTLQPLPTDELAKLSGEERTKREAEHKAQFERRAYDAKYDAATLDRLRAMGATLTPCEMPDFHFSALLSILSSEAAAAFDELTLSGRDALLTGQKPFDWPNQFRTARFTPAVDYIQAQRARTLAMAQMHDLFTKFDVIVAPSGGTQLTATNLCGQPAVIVPNGIRGNDAPPPPSTEDGSLMNVGGPGTPVSITFLAPLYEEGKACALANAYQQHAGFMHLRPKLV